IHCPDDVDHPVRNLAEELRRRTAQRHCGVDLDLYAAGRLVLNGLGPRLEHLRMRRGFGTEEMVKLELHLGVLRPGLSQIGGHRDGGSRRGKKLPTSDHQSSSRWRGGTCDRASFAAGTEPPPVLCGIIHDKRRTSSSE